MDISWQDLEAIKRVKYKYMRCVDLKRWEEIEQCFTDDATAGYSGGKYSANGRTAIIEFLVRGLGSTEILTSHTVHQPEIDLVSDTEATGVWSLEDTVIHEQFGITIQGSGFYEDRYLKLKDGSWRIQHTGYKRTYEEMFARASIEGLRLTAHHWKTNGQSEIDA